MSLIPNGERLERLWRRSGSRQKRSQMSPSENLSWSDEDPVCIDSPPNQGLQTAIEDAELFEFEALIQAVLNNNTEP